MSRPGPRAAGRTDPDGLARLRCAAALLACCPTVSLRLSHGTKVVLEVRRPPHPSAEHAVLPPCWFHGLVAGALAEEPSADGLERVGALSRCRLDLGVRDGTWVLPGEVVRVHGGSTWLHLLPVAAGVDLVRPVAEAALDAEPALGPHALHHDEALDVTVLALASSRHLAASEGAAERLRTIAVRVAVDRLERELAARHDHPARPR